MTTRDDVVRLARERMTPTYLAALALREGAGSGAAGDADLAQEERRMLRDAALELGAHDLAAEYDPSTDACTPCTSPLCHRLGISIQDAREDWRRDCAALLPLLVGSRGSDELERRRARRLLDWTVREYMASALVEMESAIGPHDAARAAELRAHAEALRKIAPVVDAGSQAAVIQPLQQLDLALARAIARARAIDLALASAIDLAFALANDIDIALVVARAFVLVLTLDLDRARDFNPVALLRELLEMRDASGGVLV